jgi:beta-phosphoglucomutase-like phosphatase (HAD superfamily)
MGGAALAGDHSGATALGLAEKMFSGSMNTALEFLSRFDAAMLERYLHRGVAQPIDGASDTLRVIRERGTVIQSVVSGNTRMVSLLKLRSAGLVELLDLATSSFGDESSRRCALLARAAQRISALWGLSIDHSELLVVGDTLADVNAARMIGARVAIVASEAVPGADFYARTPAEIAHTIKGNDDKVGTLENIVLPTANAEGVNE